MSAPITIAVVSWNTRGPLRSCLQSMHADVLSGVADVWVIDNGSSDGSREMVADEFDWAKLIEADENLGFGRAVNAVASRTSSEWIAASNSDIELEPGALERMLVTAESDRRSGVIAPRLQLPDGSWQHTIHSFPSPTLALTFNLGLGSIVPSLGNRLLLEGRTDGEEGREVDWGHGAFLLIRRAAFDQVGGFDAGQWMYAEDLDLSWRLRAAGWTTRYVPEARATHQVAAAASMAFGDERTARHTLATAEWMLRRRGRARATAYALLNLIGASARWLAVAPIARLRPERWGAARTRLRTFMNAHARALRAVTR
jgi:N-acetylglucosaminyl-diphospho-decaprenol L-rhamnosyltransferase